MKGFTVRIAGDGRFDLVEVQGTTLTVGSDHRNKLPLTVTTPSFKLAEARGDGFRLFLRDDIEVSAAKDGEAIDMKHLIKFLARGNSIDLTWDTEVQVNFEGCRFSFTMIAAADAMRVVPPSLRRSVITRENAGFSALFIIVSAILFSGIFYSIYNLQHLISLLPPAVTEVTVPAPVDVVYKATRIRVMKGEGGPASSDSAGGGSGSGKPGGGGGSGTVFHGSAALSAGVLGVQEGNRTMVISRERSLFNKLDKSIETMPVKGRMEVSDRLERDFASVGIGPGSGGGFGGGKGSGRGGGSGTGTGGSGGSGSGSLASGEKIKPTIGASQVKVTSGRRSETEILGILNRYKKGFEFIYVEERKKDPSLSGRVSIQFVIDGSGKVTSSEVVETEITRREFLSKVLALLNSIKFPPTEFGDTGVKLPLVFLAP